MSHADRSTFDTWSNIQSSKQTKSTEETNYLNSNSFGDKSIFLVAFDFDDTIVDANTDIFVQDKLNVKPYMDRLKIVYQKEGKKFFHNEVFRYFYPKTKSKKQYDRALECVPFVKNIPECIVDLKKLGAELIILSDANTYFIKHILQHKGLQKHFHHIFANPSQFDEKGNLVIDPYHNNLECKLSTVNLCKGRVLTEYLQRRNAEGVRFKFVAVAGDGINDFCPMARLHRGDIALPRKDAYICEFIREKESKDGVKLKANITRWSGGRAIVFAMRQKLSELNLL